MSDLNKVSIKELREEIRRLDEQISGAQNIQKVLEEEKKPLYVYYQWTAPERIYTPRDRRWYIIISSIAMFVIVMALLTNNFGLVFAVIALILLVYALHSVPPVEVTHELTNKGLSTFSRLIRWKEIDSFWVSKRSNHTLINFAINENNVDGGEKLIILLGNGDLDKIVQYMSQFIDYLPSDSARNGILSSITEGEIVPLSDFLIKEKTKDNPKKKDQEE